jgi:hypothetical protein
MPPVRVVGISDNWLSVANLPAAEFRTRSADDSSDYSVPVKILLGQYRARTHGSGGIFGNRGNVNSVSYRNYIEGQ